MKKNILIITIYYPPIQSVASNRLYSFAKYLDKNRYNVFVHTIGDKNSIEVENNILVQRVKNSVLFKPLLFNKRTNKFIHYLKVIYNLFVKYFFEDEYRGWVKESKKILPKFIKENNIDLIISSYAPAAPHIVALELKKNFSNIKWIADMRDEMSQGIGLPKKIKKKYEKLENEIFIYSDVVTSVSKPLIDEFKSLSKNQDIKFYEIRNGYDFDLEEYVESSNIEFTITYAGNFYGDINPINFLKALNNLVKRDKIKKIKVQFVGVKTHFNIPELLKDKITILPPQKHSKAIEIMKKSDVLLLIHPTNGRKGVYTGKLFEYLASLKPIIALVDENDVAAKLIIKANAGYVADNSNIDKIEEILNKAYKDWEEKKIRQYNIDVIKKHHRYEQTKRLEKIIDEVLNEK